MFARYINYTGISKSVAYEWGGGKIASPFVETRANPATNISGSWPTIQRAARPSGLLLLAERSNTIDLSGRSESNARSEITVINIVGPAPSQFIAKFCFPAAAMSARDPRYRCFSPR